MKNLPFGLPNQSKNNDVIVTEADIAAKKAELDKSLREKELSIVKELITSLKLTVADWNDETLDTDTRRLPAANTAIETKLKEFEQQIKGADENLQNFNNNIKKEKELAQEIEILKKKKNDNEKQQQTLKDKLKLFEDSGTKKQIQGIKQRLSDIENEIKQTDVSDLKNLQKIQTEKSNLTDQLNSFGDEIQLRQKLDDLNAELSTSTDPKSIIKQLEEKESELKSISANLGDAETRDKNKADFTKSKTDLEKQQKDALALKNNLEKIRALKSRLKDEEKLIKEMDPAELEKKLTEIHADTNKIYPDVDEKTKAPITYDDPKIVEIKKQLAELQKNREAFNPSVMETAFSFQKMTASKAEGTKNEVQDKTQAEQIQKNVKKHVDEIDRTGDVRIGNDKFIRAGQGGYQAVESSLQSSLKLTAMTILSHGNPDALEMEISEGKSIDYNNAAALFALGQGVKKVTLGTPPALNKESHQIEKIFEINSKLPPAKNYQMQGKSKFTALLKELQKDEELVKLTLSSLSAENIGKVINELEQQKKDFVEKFKKENSGADDRAISNAVQNSLEAKTLAAVKRQLPNAMMDKYKRSVDKKEAGSEINKVFKNLDEDGKAEFLNNLCSSFSKLSAFTRKKSIYYLTFKTFVDDLKKSDQIATINGKASSDTKDWIKDCGYNPTTPKPTSPTSTSPTS